LSALIGGAVDSSFTEPAKPEPVASPDGSALLFLDPTALEPNPMQPRKAFDESALEDLADSIKRDGVQEPVIVRKKGDRYELVSGERRVRASIMAGLEKVPAVCRPVSDRDMLKLGLIENIQREDLNAIETAEAYQKLLDEFSWTQEELASQVGKKRVTVTNTLRLLNLPGEVQAMVADGVITMGHARALLAFDTPEAQSAACRKIVEQGLSVRQTEKLTAPPEPKEKKPEPPKDPNIASLEDDLRRRLGTKVTLRTAAKNRGKIEIEYYNLDDLERILALLQRS
jgi:ParB family chromosome partitioning protein